MTSHNLNDQITINKKLNRSEQCKQKYMYESWYENLLIKNNIPNNPLMKKSNTDKMCLLKFYIAYKK